MNIGEMQEVCFVEMSCAGAAGITFAKWVIDIFLLQSINIVRRI
jgi:hypothetical protein